IATCRPLHYKTLLGSRACAHMAVAAWTCAVLYALLHAANTFSLTLCQGNDVDKFLCEILQTFKLSCSRAYLREVWHLEVSVCLGFVFIVVSYVHTFMAVLRMPSEHACHKAFATCLAHLSVLSLFISTGIFAYLKPPS
ncbi:O14AG protein, partial [Tricholaema leucomelas]|nr:O14AG protein [Tricholaema leucomelas]